MELREDKAEILGSWNTKPIPDELKARIEKTRADYEDWLDAFHAAARGHVDAILDPLESRRMLSFALEASLASHHRHHVAIETL